VSLTLQSAILDIVLCHFRNQPPVDRDTAVSESDLFMRANGRSCLLESFPNTVAFHDVFAPLYISIRNLMLTPMGSCTLAT
jgi:hypothetical protein